MTGLRRTDTSVIGHWWWTVDRWSLLALGLLIGVGFVLTLAASPAVATKLDFEQFHFAKRQIVFLIFGVGLMFGVSLLSPLRIRRLAVLVFLISLALVIATLLVGPEIKGAQRWLRIGGQSLQPSEFLKPTFAVVAAWMFAEGRRIDGWSGERISIALFAVVLVLLLLQPDVGMALVVSAVWFAQYFVAGLSIYWVALLGTAALAGFVLLYSIFSHVADRIDNFLDPNVGNYQIDRAMDAFALGGFLGRGPGQGDVKVRLPDAHTDFIFAVAGEEFGLALCAVIIGLFAYVVLRSLGRLIAEQDIFVLLAVTGLATQFGLQAVINIGVNLSLLPTKGMTLPFISYGGSSMLALSLGVGMMLALTRRRPRAGDER